MSDDKLAIDEARRAAQHEAVKSQVEGVSRLDKTALCETE